MKIMNTITYYAQKYGAKEYAPFRVHMVYYLVIPLVKLCAFLRISPNVVSIIGIISVFICSSILVLYNNLFIFGIGIFLQIIFDYTDGMLARYTHTQSYVGRIIDVTSDILSGSFLLIAITWYQVTQYEYNPFFIHIFINLFAIFFIFVYNTIINELFIQVYNNIKIHNRSYFTLPKGIILLIYVHQKFFPLPNMEQFNRDEKLNIMTSIFQIWNGLTFCQTYRLLFFGLFAMCGYYNAFIGQYLWHIMLLLALFQWIRSFVCYKHYIAQLKI